jgi:hypothetical protein
MRSERSDLCTCRGRIHDVGVLWLGGASARPLGTGEATASGSAGGRLGSPWSGGRGQVRRLTLGSAGAAGQVLGASDVGVACVCWQRLLPRASWALALADMDLPHRRSFRLVPGRRCGPPSPRWAVGCWPRLVVTSSAWACLAPGPSASERPPGASPAQGAQVRLPGGGLFRCAGSGSGACQATAAAARAVAGRGQRGRGRRAVTVRWGGRCGGMHRPSGSSAPVSSNITTPLQSRLHPCSG